MQNFTDNKETWLKLIPKYDESLKKLNEEKEKNKVR